MNGQSIGAHPLRWQARRLAGSDLNGVAENVRTSVTDTLKVADLHLGNWGAANDANNDLKDRLDDVLVYNAALDARQVQAIYGNAGECGSNHPQLRNQHRRRNEASGNLPQCQ
jgi:hypothetical protein